MYSRVCVCVYVKLRNEKFLILLRTNNQMTKTNEAQMHSDSTW